MTDLKEKVAIITGASSGIGRATAKLFARAGAKIVVAARRKAELESLVREIADQGGRALALAGANVRRLQGETTLRVGGRPHPGTDAKWCHNPTETHFRARHERNSKSIARGWPRPPH
jgi:NAD(P)-dependent dehydrogenase (short-subunit alcohol dehydrogenase family)